MDKDILDKLDAMHKQMTDGIGFPKMQARSDFYQMLGDNWEMIANTLHDSIKAPSTLIVSDRDAD